MLLINHLDTLIPKGASGAFNSQVLNGMQKYLSNQGISTSLFVDTATISQVQSCVVNDKPFVMLINGAPTYGNHFVTGYGYMQSNGNNYAGVNDGWGNRDIYINLAYANVIIHH